MDLQDVDKRELDMGSKSQPARSITKVKHEIQLEIHTMGYV